MLPRAILLKRPEDDQLSFEEKGRTDDHTRM